MATIQTANQTQGDGYNVPNMPSNAIVVTKSDVDNFDIGIHLYVGVSGDVRVLPEFGSQPVTFTAFPAGMVLPVKVVKVFSTGTTASNLIGVF